MKTAMRGSGRFGIMRCGIQILSSRSNAMREQLEKVVDMKDAANEFLSKFELSAGEKLTATELARFVNTQAGMVMPTLGVVNKVETDRIILVYRVAVALLLHQLEMAAA
jgi:hypothetical protein